MEHQLASFPGADVVEARVAALQAFYITDRLGEITVPILALAAKDDMLVPWTCSRALAAAVPSAKFELMEYGAHACNVTDATRFNQIVSAWLTAAPSEGA